MHTVISEVFYIALSDKTVCFTGVTGFEACNR